MAMALLQGGSSVHLLSPSVYSYLCGMKPHDIIVDITEIPDENIKVIMEKVSNMTRSPQHLLSVHASQIVSAPTSSEFCTLYSDNFELISNCGFTKPVTRLNMEDRVLVVQSMALHEVILKTLGELSQFRDGLESLGVASALQQHGSLLRSFFVKEQSKLTAGKIARSKIVFITFYILNMQITFVAYLRA